MFKKLDEVEAVFEDMESRLTSPEVVGNAQGFQRLSKEHAALIPLVTAYREFKELKKQFDGNLELIQSEDAGDLKTMALEENADLEKEISAKERHLRILLLPKDPNDERNIILEIRAGAGGDEAGIFAGDLYGMYRRYAEKLGWKVEPMSISTNDVGGFKEIIAMITGDKVYSRLKYESGVHRVQRVPKTETQGRIHTSTVTVAILPEADEVEVHLNPNDLRIDVFRSSGPGGQSVNTTDSAVRVTHNPTGLAVICRDEKSQHKNKAKALKVLASRLLEQKQRAQDEKISADRLSQVGSGDRSEKIRTYNFPQGRVTDHRIGVTLHQIDSFVGGDIEPMLSQLSAFYESEALKQQTNS